MKHWLTAVEFVTLIAVYAAVMWILLAFARHAHRRILIMLDAHYSWTDAGVLLRRQTKQKLGPDPGKHRAEEKQPPPARMLAIEAPWPPPESDVVVADVAGGTDLLDPEARHAAGAVREQDFDPLPVTDPASTMTMTQPVAIPRWDGPGPPPPWYPQEGE